MTITEFDARKELPEPLQRFVADLEARVRVGLVCGLDPDNAPVDAETLGRDRLATAAFDAARLAPERWRAAAAEVGGAVDLAALVEDSPTALRQRYGYLRDLEDPEPPLFSEREGKPAGDGPAVREEAAVRLRLHSVTCRSNGWFDKSDVAVSGVWAGPDEVAGTIPRRQLGTFEDGTTIGFQPMVLQTRPLGPEYPQVVSAVVVLAELRYGGLMEFVHELLVAIREAVAAVIVVMWTAAGAHLGSGIGAAVGTAIAGPVGTVVGAVAGFVVGAAVGWLVLQFRDVVLPPFETMVVVEAPPTGGLVVKGNRDLQVDSLDYHVEFDWYATA